MLSPKSKRSTRTITRPEPNKGLQALVGSAVPEFTRKFSGLFENLPDFGAVSFVGIKRLMLKLSHVEMESCDGLGETLGFKDAEIFFAVEFDHGLHGSKLA